MGGITGRITAIKMNILPKILFLFQTIPIILKKIFFNELDKLTTRFIQEGQKPRIRLNFYKKIKGGFGVPNWQLYYQAAALNWIKDWINEG